MKLHSLLLIFLFGLFSASAQTPEDTMTPALTPGDFPAAAAWFSSAGAAVACDGGEVLVDTNSTVDFSGAQPVFQGDADLAPFFSFEKSGDAPFGWKAIFELGSRSLRIAEGVTLTVANMPWERGRAAPGLEIRSTCGVVIQGVVRLEADDAETGDLTILSAGDLLVSGTVHNGIQGTWGVTGLLTLAVGGGDLRIEPQASVSLKGSQLGGQGLNLLAFGAGGDLNIAGWVEASFDNNLAPFMNLAAFQGRIDIDGTHFLGEDNEANRLTTGVRLRSNVGFAMGDMKVVARDDVRVLGFGDFEGSGGDSVSFTTHMPAVANSQVVPTTVSLTNLPGDTVQIDLSIPAGSGVLRACFGNFFNESLLEGATFAGDHLNRNRFIRANGVDGISDFWMSPPGGWDFGLGLTDVTTQATFTVTAPGLNWRELLVAQRNAKSWGVIIETPTNTRLKNNQLVRMVLPTPYLTAARQDGALAVKNKGASAPGGNLTVQSLIGTVTGVDHAFDTGNGNNADKFLTLEAAGDIDLRTSNSSIAAMLGGVPVVDSRANGSAGAVNTIRSYSGRITVGPQARVLTGASGSGGINRLIACVGVTLDGEVLPADADTSDDSGFCPPPPDPLELIVTTPQEGELVNTLPLTVSGTVSPLGADVNVNGVGLTPDNGAWSTELTLDQGPAVIAVQAIEGGRTADVVRNVFVDTLPPVIVWDGPATIVMGETLRIEWSTVDISAVTTDVRFGDIQIGTDPKGEYSMIVPLDPDLTELVFIATAQDAAGNISDPEELRVTVSQPDLSIAIDSPADGFLTNAGNVLVRGTVSPADTPVSLNGNPVAVSGSNWELDLLLTTEGEILLSAEAVSPLGTVTAERNLIRDVTPPVLTLSAPDAVERGATFAVAWSGEDNRAVTFSELLMESELLSTQVSGATDVVAPVDPALTRISFQLTARDEAGNQSIANRVVAVNGPQLTLAFTQPAEGLLTNQNSVTVSGVVSPADTPVLVNGIAVTVSGENWTGEIPLDTEGLITLTARAELLGESAEAVRSIVRDVTPPVLTLNAPPQAEPGNAFTYNWTVTDDSALASVTLQRDGETVSNEAQGSQTHDVPLNTSAAQVVLDLAAVDAAGNAAGTQVIVSLIDPADLDPVVITITSPGHQDLFASPGVVIQGSVMPANAELTVKGSSVAVAADGGFSLNTTLGSGLNTFLFRGRASGYRPGTAKLDLYLDDIDPVVTITSPVAGFQTNREQVTIQGTLTDQYDRTPGLARDGNPIVVRSSRFSEEVTLSPGDNTFTYTATDEVGRTGQASITITYRTEGPQIDLQHPQLIRPGDSFELAVTFSPLADIVRADVFANHQLLHSQESGQAYSGTIEFIEGIREIPVVATAVDSFGNRAEAKGLVRVSYPHYVHGKVLDDRTSYPLGGIPVVVTTPLEQVELITHEDGGYDAYVYGYPVDVAVSTAAYAAIQRHMAQPVNSWRVPDLRLTPLGVSADVATTLADGDLVLALSGNFSGTARLTALGAQAIPELPPMGYAPLASFELAGAVGDGAMDLQLVDPVQLPAGARVLVLLKDGTGWTVMQSLTFNAAGAYRIEQGSAGSWLLAVRDSLTEAEPAVGVRLLRELDVVVPPNTLADSLTDPARVSVRDEPQTLFTCVLQSGGELQSGVRARLTAREIHQRYSETIVVPDYQLDFYAYTVGFGGTGDIVGLGGSLNIRARHEVLPERTEQAEITFLSEAGDKDPSAFLDNPVQEIGDLTLDFSGSSAQPRVVHAEQSGLRIPLTAGATQVASFWLSVGGRLDQSAELNLNAPQSAAVVMLRKRDGESTWDYVGKLTHDGSSWRNDSNTTDLRDSGDYMLLALDYAVSEVLGTIRNAGGVVAHADLFVTDMPWMARSDENGNYRIALPQTDQSQTLRAEHKGLRREGAVVLATTLGRDVLSGRDIELGNRDFRLLRHEPAADQLHVSFLPQIILEFNRPVSEDVDLLAAQIQLSAGDAVPVEIVAEPGRDTLRLLPLQALPAETVCTVSLGAGLLSLHGDPLDATTFTFTTRAAVVPNTMSLAGFYLSIDGGQMNLRAPAETLVAGTQLRVYNPTRGSGFSTVLLNQDFVHAIDAVPGDAIELRSLDPAGNVQQRLIDVIKTGENTFRLGARPFSLRINSELIVHVDEVLSGVGSELRIVPASPAEMTAVAAETAALEDAPALVPVQGFLAELTAGEFPRFKMRLQLQRDLNEFNGRVLMPMSFQRGVLAPANPETPDVISENTMMRIYDAVAIENGEPASDALKAKGAAKFSLVGLMMSMEAAAISGTVPTPDPVGTQVFIGIKGSAAPMDATQHPNYDYVECSRVNVSTNPPIPVPTYDSHPWQDALPGGSYPVPGTPVYMAIGGNDDHPTYYRLMGVADRTGRADIAYFGQTASLRGVDIVTGQLEFAAIRTLDNVHHATGFSLLTYANRPLNFNPEEYHIELGAPPPPSLASRWEVGRLVDGAFTIDDEQTTQLRDRRRIDVDAELLLKLTIQSSQAIAVDPEPNLSTQGMTQPNNPEISGQSITWTFPAGVAHEGGLVETSATIHTTHGTQNTITDRFMIVDDGPLADIPGAPPFVLYTHPEDEEEGVLVSDAVVVAFSEPVHGINPTTLVLFDVTNGGPVPVTYYNRNGAEITQGSDESAVVHMVPNEPLNFDSEFEIRVSAVLDREDSEPEEDFVATFKTAPFDAVDNLSATYRSQIIGLKNLVLIVSEDWNQSHYDIDIYDTRNPYEPMRRVGGQRMHKGAQDAFIRVSLFTPEDFEETGGGTLGDPNEMLDSIPAGSILMTTRQRFPSDVSHMEVFRYNGGSFDELFAFDAVEPGLCYAMDKMGKYAVLAFKNFGYWSYQDIIPAKTVVYDILKMVDDYDATVGSGGNRIEFERNLQSLAVVAKYPLPGDVSSVTTFTRKENDGDFTQIKPAFLLGGFYHPAIFDFDLSNQPPYPGMAMPTDDPRFDGRLVARSEYQSGESAMMQSTAALPSLGYRDPVEGLREIDLAIFSERGQSDRILFFDIPRDGGMSTVTIDPLKVLEMPGRFFSFALDRSTGLLAIQGLDGQFSILDVKTFLETPSGGDVPGFGHPAFLFESREMPLQHLTFLSGNLFGHAGNPGSITRTPISPTTYRAVGWEYFDLAEWMNPKDEAQTEGNLTNRVKFAKQMVFHATDLPVNGDTLTFTLEQGSYAIEIDGGGDVFVEVVNQATGQILETLERRDLIGASLERFAMTPVRDYFKNQAAQINLRERGYAEFQLKWRIEKDGVEQARDESDFLVVYRHPETRQLDPHRSLDLLDGLALMPNLHVRDHLLTSVDPRLDLSPSRAYNADYAFQAGLYGGGMLSGQMLYMALPVWWDIAGLGAAAHDGAAAYPRVILEQPGKFQSNFQIEDTGLTATPLNNLTDTLDRTGTRWRFVNAYNMLWELAAKDKLPDFKAVFEAVNHRVEDADQMRFPVFRFTAPTSETPPGLLGEAAVVDQRDLRYNNRIKFQDGSGRTSNRPEQVKEIVNDSGGMRTNVLDYDYGPIGRHVVSNTTADGLELTYEYDSDGYLTRVTRNGARPISYDWEQVGELELGDFVVKRLVEIQVGSGDEAEFTQFQYGSGDSLKVTDIATNYGSKSVGMSLGSNGLPEEVSLPGLDAPGTGVSFADAGGLLLSSSYDMGGQNFAVTWAQTSRDASSIWNKIEDGFRDEIMSYNNDGLLVSRQLDGVINHIWTYGNAGPFKEVPSGYTDPEEQEFSILANSGVFQTTANGVSVITRRSSSGASVGRTDIYGFRTGTGNSKFYNAFDGRNFQQSNGRPTRSAVPGRSLAAGELSFNAFGDITRSVTMGMVTTNGDFNSLGRPTTNSILGGISQIIAYAYSNGRYVVTTTDEENGRITREEYNELNWLMRWEETIGDGTRYYNYAYDDYGRLTSVTGSHEAGFVYRAVYGDLTDMPDRVITPGEELEYVKGAGGRITGMIRTVDGSSETIIYETDLLGREVRFEQKDLGAVEVTYDPFGRPLSRKKIGAGDDDPAINYTYGAKSVTVADGFTELNTEVRYGDDAAWDQTVTVSGDGVDNPRTLNTNTTVQGSGNGKGYRFSDQESGTGITKTRHYDVLGNERGASFGKYSFTAIDGAEDRFGQPREFGGGWSESLDYDDYGRLTTIADAHGHQSSLAYDTHHRVSSGSNSRGQTFELDYLNSVYREVSNLKVAEVDLFQRSDRNQAGHQNWMGIGSQTIQTARNQSMQLLRGDDGEGNPLSASYDYDRASGLLQSFEDFSGNTTSFTWSKGGRNMVADLPGGRRWSVETDGYGQLRNFDLGGGKNIRVQRDNNDRITNVVLPGRTFNFQYQGEDLVGLQGTNSPISFSGHNGQGMPTQIRVEGRGVIDLQYHQGGIPSNISIRRNGGPAKVLRTNTHGDLTYLKRAHTKALQYGYNQWGVANSVAVGNQAPTQLFSDADPFSLTLPGGVTAQLDNEGRVTEIDAPGVAARQLSYDRNGNITNVTTGGVTGEQFVRENGRLTQVISGEGEYADTTVYSYNDLGAIESISNDLDGTNEFTYPTDPEEPRNRVESFTAPNGVTYDYLYDETGYISRIDLTDGPTFVYERDAAGNLTGVHVDGMGATLADYQNGIPQTITWTTDDGFTDSLQLQQTEGRLDSVIGAGFSLELSWAQPPPDAPEDAPMIERVVRSGPGFRETWEPSYDDEDRLISTTITREDPDCVGCTPRIIEETYGSPLNRLLGGLRRTVDGQTVVDLINAYDSEADQQRLSGQSGVGGQVDLDYDALGNLTGLDHGGDDHTLAYDGLRRLRRVETQRAGETQTEHYTYDYQSRRVGTDHPQFGEIVYAYHASRVIAMGVREAGAVRWTHAFGYSAAGPLFMKDLTYSGLDAFIFTDHLGTPFGWKQPATGEVFYTPFNPWGELLAQQPANGPLYAGGGIPNDGFQLPPDPVFYMPPLGLGGHIYDQTSGLVYMHHRFYHPRLGHFTTADFRLPNIYDATSFTEPYAYASGNPIMFRDPDGRSWLSDTVGGWFNDRADLLEETAKGFSDDSYFEIGLSALAGASAFVVDTIGSAVELVDGAVETSVETTLLAVDATGIRGEANARFALSEINAKVESVKAGAEGLANLVEYAYENPGEVVDKTVAAIGKQAENWEKKSLTEKVFSGTKLVGDIVATVASGGATSATKIKHASDVVDTAVDAGRNLNRGGNGDRKNPAKRDDDEVICDLGLCFVAGTLVLTPDGPKPIEDIRAGELVAARDEDSGETDWMPVSSTNSRQSRPIQGLTVVNADGMVETFEVTPEHPVWLEGRGWTLVDELEEGDQLAGFDDTWQVADVVDLDRTADVFNLEVAYVHNYFAGENGLWVHNGGKDDCRQGANGVVDLSKGVDYPLKRPDGVSDEEWQKKLAALNKGAQEGRAKVVYNPVRDGKAQAKARKDGLIEDGHDADHGLDLQFGGTDNMDEIISLNSRVNRSVGGQGRKRMRYPDGTKINSFFEEK